MRWAIISDLHGDFAPLQAVIRDLEVQGRDQVLVGGDLVLGGRQPAEVPDVLIERRWPAVLGNTDAFVLKWAPLERHGSAVDALERLTTKP